MLKELITIFYKTQATGGEEAILFFNFLHEIHMYIKYYVNLNLC